MTWKTFPLALERADRITPNILHLAFRRPDAEAFEYTAGQFINIHFEADGKSVHRSYSVATPPGRDGLIEIAISRVEGGHATSLLFGLKPGEQVEASGPYGRFVLRDDPVCRYILVGTGTGVTPYRAMLPGLAQRLGAGETEVELLLGVWRRDELLYGEEFLEFAARHPQFGFHACYSREMPSDPQPHEHSGYVQSHFGRFELDPERDIVYLCGNPNMVDEAVGLLKTQGFPIPRIRREKYLPARD